MKYRLLLSFFALLLLLTACFPVSAAAAEVSEIEAYNENVAKIVSGLEAKYNIKITYPIRQSGYASVGPQTLATLDSSLVFITPELVSELSSFFKMRTGNVITVAFEYPPLSLRGMTLASFNVDKAQLRIFIPYNNGEMLITGTNPTAIVHEMGHAFHEFAQYHYGAQNLEQRWGSFSYPYTYSKGYTENPNPTVFATTYAASDYHEDFAETFAQAFTANRPGLGISEYLFTDKNIRTDLGQKIKMMEELIRDYSKKGETALENVKKIYSTPRTFVYQGISFSGNSLQYMGFAEPNGVYKAIERHLGVQTKKSYWIAELGAWYIESTAADEFYAFPGGSAVNLKAVNVA